MGQTRDRGVIASHFDARATSYDESASHRWQAEQAVATLAPAPGDAVVDVATGTGLVLRAMDAAAPGDTRLVGVDVAIEMLNTARRRSPARRQRPAAPETPLTKQ